MFLIPNTMQSRRGGRGGGLYETPILAAKNAKIHIFHKFVSFQVRNTEDSSYRNLRDWYIYRDYMNGLEYVIHAFDHLKKHHQ